MNLGKHRRAGAAIADRRYAKHSGEAMTSEQAEQVWLEVQLALAAGVRMVNLRDGVDDPAKDREAYAAALEGFASRARELALREAADNDA